MAITITSIEHGFSIAYHDLTVFLGKAKAKLPVVEKDVTTIEQIVDGVVGTVDPALAPVIRAIEALVGAGFAVIDGTDAAVAAKGVSIPLDIEVFNELKSFVTLLSKHPAVQSAAAATAPGA